MVRGDVGCQMGLALFADLGAKRAFVRGVAKVRFEPKVIDAAECTKVWYAIFLRACGGANYV